MATINPPQNELEVWFEVLRLADFLLSTSPDIAQAVTSKIQEILKTTDGYKNLQDGNLQIVFAIEATKLEYQDLKEYLAKLCARQFCEILLAEKAPARGRRSRDVPEFSYQNCYDLHMEFRCMVSGYALEMASSAYRQGTSHNLYTRDLITGKPFRVYKD
jgi:hypothetical protein